MTSLSLRVRVLTTNYQTVLSPDSVFVVFMYTRNSKVFAPVPPQTFFLFFLSDTIPTLSGRPSLSAVSLAIGSCPCFFFALLIVHFFSICYITQKRSEASLRGAPRLTSCRLSVCVCVSGCQALAPSDLLVPVSHCPRFGDQG